MIVPNFEIKDSYIIKNKINYDVSTGGEFSSATYGILYTDYDLARKTQKYNAENFSNITLSGISLSSYDSIIMNHYNETYTLTLDGYLQSEYIVNSTNLYNNMSYIRYLVDSSSSYDVGDYLDIYFYQKNSISGTTNWEHDGLFGEVFYVSGLTSNGNQWESTGLTTSGGYTTGTTNWYLDELIPVFKYNTFVTNTDSTYIYTKKVIEEYLVNNLLKYASLYYKVINLNHCPKDYDNISNYLKKSIFGGYLDFSFINTGSTLLVSPKKNILDIYFDFDNFDFILNGLTPIMYKFYTKNLYNKYTLERFLDQFDDSGISSGNTIYIDYSATTTSSGYTGEYEFDIYLSNSGDTKYFQEYTYINIHTDLSNYYRCVLLKINGTTFTILQPKLSLGEMVIKIDNLYTVKDISDMLYGCFVNIDDYVIDYTKMDIETRRKIYESYYRIINDLDINNDLRDDITGVLFENSNNVFVLKIYNPQEVKDKRLSYSPVESTILGKNKKTTVPFRVDSVRPIQFDVIDDNVYSNFVIDDNFMSDAVICWDPMMVLSWDVDTNLVYGDKIPSAKSNIEGIFQYSPTGLTVGITTVTATFYPSNKLIYQDGETTAVTFTVSKAPLYVSGNTTTKIYGDENPSFYVIYDGFVNNQTASNLTIQPSISCSATKTSDVGIYAIVPSSGVSSNYNFIYTDGSLTIEKATPTIEWDNPSPITTTTPLSSTQLNATVTESITGVFTYSPDFGAYLSKGTQTLVVTFTPSSPYDINWNVVTDSVNIVVVET